MFDEIVGKYLGAADPQLYQLPFAAAGVDSFLLMGIRADLEIQLGRSIPDEDWTRLSCLQEIGDYCRAAGLSHTGGPAAHQSGTVGIRRGVTINMPQMLCFGLSENWLLKELGDLHWAMICDGLGVASHELRDKAGNRLYASFVRVRLEGSVSLDSFHENETLHFAGGITRFGNSMFFSSIDVAGGQRRVAAQLATTFSYREAERNQLLVRGQPLVPDDCPIAELPALPELGRAYRALRSGQQDTLLLAGEACALREEVLFETRYTINPFRDLNGVNLLYFASYPVISDMCEAAFVQDAHPALAGHHWGLASSVQARDTLYYGNCDIDDQIVYRLHTFEPLADGRVKIVSSLARLSDGRLMARLFTIKRVTGSGLTAGR